MKTLSITWFKFSQRTGLLIAMTAVLLMGTLSFMTVTANAIAPDNQAPAPSVESCKKNFLGLKPWYEYIDGEFKSSSAAKESLKDPCSIKCFNFLQQSKPNECGQSKSDIPAVLLAVADDLLRIAGLVALGFLISGAFQYVMSQGNPDDASKAQGTVINALLGLAIAIVAVAFVSYIGNRLGG